MNDCEKETIEFSTNINHLLKSIESGILSQQQFHSPASHRLKNSMSIIRGMLEVLNRRRRDPAVYEEKLKEVIGKVDGMGVVVEQALLLCWLNSNQIAVSNDTVNLYCLLSILEDKWLSKLYETNLSLQIHVPRDKEVVTDCYLLELVLDKLIGNSVLHSRRWSNIHVEWDDANATLLFFAVGSHDSQGSRNIGANNWIPGNLDHVPVEAEGKLMHAIVSRAASLIHLQVQFTEVQEHQTFFSLQFPSAILLSKS